MFGLLYRLLVFVLLIWVARQALRLLVRLFGGRSRAPGIKRPESPSAAPPAEEKANLPEEDIIDVSYTEVDQEKR